jgi:branched-chain amino acid aminotransferase
MSHPAPRVWLNGSLIDHDRATIHFLTPALHYGIGVFEGIRCYATDGGPAVFRLTDHVDRLVRSAHILGFRDLPYDRATLAGAIVETVRASGFADCYVRPLIYLAEGGWNLDVDDGRPHVGIAVWQWDAYLGDEARRNGVRANVASLTRLHPNIQMTRAKISGNYANSALAKTESRRLGFDEAIMLDPEGYVAECTGENIFVVRGDDLLMPQDGAVLSGITRATVVTIARDLGWTVQESRLTRDGLYAADEVFVCGTAAEVVALREIDFRTVGRGGVGPVTRAIQDAYHEAVRGRHPRSSEWLTPVA